MEWLGGGGQMNKVCCRRATGEGEKGGKRGVMEASKELLREVSGG